MTARPRAGRGRGRGRSTAVNVRGRGGRAVQRQSSTRANNPHLSPLPARPVSPSITNLPTSTRTLSSSAISSPTLHLDGLFGGIASPNPQFTSLPLGFSNNQTQASVRPRRSQDAVRPPPPTFSMLPPVSIHATALDTNGPNSARSPPDTHPAGQRSPPIRPPLPPTPPTPPPPPATTPPPSTQEHRPTARRLSPPREPSPSQ